MQKERNIYEDNIKNEMKERLKGQGEREKGREGKGMKIQT
jgi:hypothetical protein